MQLFLLHFLFRFKHLFITVLIIIADMLNVNSYFRIFAILEDFLCHDLAKENNLNLKLLEESAGFGNGTIRRWDNSPPAADKLLKVANMLNTSCEFLLTGKEQTPEYTEFDMEILSLFHQLPRDAQLEFKGELKGYLKHLDQEASNKKLKQAK